MGFFPIWTDKTWSVGAACNAIVAGVVGAGIFYFFASKLMLNVLKIDDPLDAFAVHGMTGFFAVIFANTAASPYYAYGAICKGDTPACTFPSSATLTDTKANEALDIGQGFITAIVTLLAEIGWVAGCSILMFVPLKLVGLLRVSSEVETAGMDVSKHGGSAYEAPAGASGASA